MKFTTVISSSALIGLALAAPAPNGGEPCLTVWETSTVTSTSQCPIASLPLSPIVTGTLVPVGSITSDLLGILGRAPEPTAGPVVVPRNNICYETSTTVVTTTVKPDCGIVNSGSVGK